MEYLKKAAISRFFREIYVVKRISVINIYYKCEDFMKKLFFSFIFFRQQPLKY